MRARLDLGSPRRLLGLGLLVLLSLFLAGWVPGEAPREQHVITLNPTSGPPGTVVTVSGSGWTGNTSGHEIHWYSPTGQLLGTFSTNPNGAFSKKVTIPANARPGLKAIWACDRCNLPGAQPIWVSANFDVLPVATLPPTRVPRTPTPTDVPTECDALGVAGELVIDFEGLSTAVIERGAEVQPGVLYKGDIRAQVVQPDVDTKSPTHALVNSEMMEFGSIGDPLRFGFNYLQDFVGVYVGLENPQWADSPITATMTARGYPCEPDAEGHFACAPTIVGADSVSFGPEATPIKECLSVEGQNIFEVTIDYGPAADPETIDNLTLRGPEEPEPLPEDDAPPVVMIEMPEGDTIYFTNSLRLQGTVREDRELASMRYRVNSGPFHDMGFTSAGYTPEGERLYLFAVDPLRVDEIRTCGDNLVEVVAVDTSDNEGGGWTAFSVYYGDLAVTSVEPVQVVYGADLVHGKGTAFRVRVNSSYTCQIRAKFLLALPEGQWDTSVPSSGLTRPAVPGGWEYPELWGPVPIPANAVDYEVMLPYIEPGQEDAAFDPISNPAGIVKDPLFHDNMQPDVRVVPRPVADPVGVSVVIDPQDDWQEEDEANNEISSAQYNVVKTRAWRILFIPYTTENLGCFGPVLHQVNYAAHNQMEYLLATYPIAEGKLSFEVMEESGRGECGEGRICGYSAYYGGSPDRAVLLNRFASMAEGEEFDFAVGVDCGGAGGAILGFDGAVIIGAESGLVTLAHEFNHAVVGMGDIYSLDCMVGWDEAYCEYPDGSREYCCYVDGWTHPDGAVRKHCAYDDAGEIVCEERNKECVESCDCSIYHLEPPEGWTRACYDTNESGEYSIPSCDAACCANVCRGYCPDAQVYNGPDGRITHPASEGFWVNRWMPVGAGSNYFMDIPAAGPEPGYWMRLDSTGSHCSDILFRDGMRAMLESPKFRSLEDPRILLVSGMIYRLGAATLDPMYILERGAADLTQGDEGDYYIVFRGAGGEELGRAGFSVIFYQADPNGGPRDFVPFVHRMEWLQGTNAIELVDLQGRILARREASPNAPSIEIISPNGGEKWAPEKQIRIRWASDDLDGDQLLYALSISSDGGETWLPLAIDISDKEFALNADVLSEDVGYLIKVRATDGINTAEDISDGTFTISSEAAQTPSILIPIALASLGIVGVALLLVAGVRFLRRRA